MARELPPDSPRVANRCPVPAIAILSLSLALAVGDRLRADPPIRSHHFDGTGRVSYPDNAAFEPAGEFTIEVWVYRSDSARCETILSKGFTSSLWLGFCPIPRLYTAGGQFVDANRGIPSSRWCHLAVVRESKGGVIFYIDGQPAGGGGLPPVADNANPLVLGADTGGGFHFDGLLDELRIWHVARTQQEIQAGRYRELQALAQIAAVFPDGVREVQLGLTAQIEGTVEPRIHGMLPRDLRVPRVAASPALDGVVDPLEYEGSELMVLRYHEGGVFGDALARLVHDGENLYVGVSGLRPSTAQQVQPGLSLLFDPDLVPNGHTTPDEKLISVPLDGAGPVVRYRGDGEFGYLRCDETGDCPEDALFDALPGAGCELASQVGPCVEYRISRSLLGPDTSTLGMALWHFGFRDPVEDQDFAFAPDDAATSDPTTWAFVELETGPEPPGGEGDCKSPFQVPSQGPFPFARSGQLSGFPVLPLGAGCLPVERSGRGAVYAFTPAETGRYRIGALGEADTDVAIVVSLDCPFEDGACLAGSDEYGAGDPEVIDVTLNSQTTYFIHVVGPGEQANDGGLLHLRIGRSGLAPPTVARAHPNSEQERALLLDLMTEVWHESDLGPVTGEIDREVALDLLRDGIGMTFHTPPPAVTPPGRPPVLRFDRFIYDGEDVTEITLNYLESGVTAVGTLTGYVVTEEGKDVETLLLEPAGDHWEGTLPVSATGEPGENLDGLLQVEPGQILIGLYTDPDANRPEPTVGVAMMSGRQPKGLVSVEVDPALERPVLETPGLPGEPPRAVGALADDSGAVMMLGIDQLVVDTRTVDLQEELAGLGATVVSYEVGGQAQAAIDAFPYKLIRFDPPPIDRNDAAVILELAGARGSLRVSDEATLWTICSTIESRLRGINVSPNFLIEPHASPRLGTGERNVFDWPPLTECLQGAQRVWMMSSLFDNEDRRIRVAVIDSDFCPDLTSEISLAGGFNFHGATSAPWGITNEIFAGKRYHGSKMATIIGGRWHNGVGAGGHAGNIADLLLYNVGSLSYFYEASLATLTAVSNGARVINMSFGFPCAFGPFNLCDPAIGGATCVFLGPIVDAAILAAQPFIPIPLPPTGACFIVNNLLSSMNTALTAAIATAEAANVAVIASSGNSLGGFEALPMETYHIIPAMIPFTISVAVTDGNHENTQIYGATVDVWVRESNQRWSPETETENCESFVTGDVFGSSPGAASVSALVAQMRSANPRLNTWQIRSILRRNTVPTPGPASDWKVRRFLKFHEAFIDGTSYPTGDLPDPRRLAPSLGFDEIDPATKPSWVSGPGDCGWAAPRSPSGDTPADAVPIAFAQASLSGAIIHDAALHRFTASGALENDYYRLEQAPPGEDCRAYRLQIYINYFTRGGDLDVDIPVVGSRTRAVIGDLTQLHFDARRIPLDAPLLFNVTGDDNFYEMLVLVDPEASSLADRLEVNDTTEDATVVAETEFTTLDTATYREHRLLIEDLTFDCPDDVDVFLIDLPPLREDCQEPDDICGESPATRRLTQLHITGSGMGLIEVRRPSDGELIEALYGSVRIPCPVSIHGLDQVLLVLRPFGTLTGGAEYDLNVRYRAPLAVQNVAGFICCERLGGCNSTTPDRIPEGALTVDFWSPFDDLPHPSEFDVVCPPGDCEFPPSMYWQIDWSEAWEGSIGLGLELARPAPSTFEGVLLDLEHEVVATMVPEDPDRLGFTLQAPPLAGGTYFFRLRGLPHRAGIESLFNIDPLAPVPAATSLTPVVTDTSACGSEATVGIRLESDEPVTATSFGLGWDPDVSSLVVIALGPGVDPAAVQAFIPVRTDESLGEATVGIVLKPGMTLDASDGAIVAEVRFRALSESATGPVCVLSGLGEPPVLAVTSVDRPGGSVSLTPSLGCTTVSLSRDTVPPTIVCPADFQMPGSANGATVEFTVEASDDCGDVEVTCDPPSGSVFPVGTTQVLCEVRDAAGNVAECSFEVTVSDVPRFRRGDVDGRGGIDITDAVNALDYMFLGGFDPTCLDAVDVNDDSLVDITDAVNLLGYQFLGEAPPAPPGPRECGPDPTGDTLGECVYDDC